MGITEALAKARSYLTEPKTSGPVVTTSKITPESATMSPYPPQERRLSTSRTEPRSTETTKEIPVPNKGEVAKVYSLAHTESSVFQLAALTLGVMSTPPGTAASEAPSLQHITDPERRKRAYRARSEVVYRQMNKVRVQEYVEPTPRENNRSGSDRVREPDQRVITSLLTEIEIARLQDRLPKHPASRVRRVKLR